MGLFRILMRLLSAGEQPAVRRRRQFRVIAPERIRDVANRAGLSAQSMTEDDALQLARRVHATWSITADRLPK